MYYVLYFDFVEYYRSKGKKRRKLRRKKKERKHYFQSVENIWLPMDPNRRYNHYRLILPSFDNQLLKMNNSCMNELGYMYCVVYTDILLYVDHGWTNSTKRPGNKPEPVKLHLMIYGFV